MFPTGVVANDSFPKAAQVRVTIRGARGWTWRRCWFLTEQQGTRFRWDVRIGRRFGLGSPDAGSAHQGTVQQQQNGTGCMFVFWSVVSHHRFAPFVIIVLASFSLKYADHAARNSRPNHKVNESNAITFINVGAGRTIRRRTAMR